MHDRELFVYFVFLQSILFKAVSIQLCSFFNAESCLKLFRKDRRTPEILTAGRGYANIVVVVVVVVLEDYIN